MKTVKETLPKMIVFFLILVILCGVVYPLSVTGISYLFMRHQATGSIIEIDGIKYGSELIGQSFTEDKYLWGRSMNVDTTGFTDEAGNPLMYAWASGNHLTDENYGQILADRAERIEEAHPEKKGVPIPSDLLTVSGSGLDPEISPEAAEYQVERIARTRGITADEVRQIIATYTTGRAFGIFGEPGVNVLKVNLALDGRLE